MALAVVTVVEEGSGIAMSSSFSLFEGGGREEDSVTSSLAVFELDFIVRKLSNILICWLIVQQERLISLVFLLICRSDLE